MLLGQNLGLMRGGNRGGIPRQGLLFFRKNGTTDTIGESTLIITVGDGGPLVDMTFGFSYDATMQGIDTGLGGGVLFTGSTPIQRTWAEWFALASINVDFLWIGQRGIAGYSVDQSANAAKIIRYLYCYEPVVIPPNTSLPYTLPFTL